MLFSQHLLKSVSIAALVASGAVAVSDAETLAGSETDALAMVFTDDYHQATTGFYGSVFCVDSGTPANDYDSSPTTEASSYLTYTAPSPKMILHDDGVLKYAAHNLYLNSASPANQAITVVIGATYAVTITGSVSVTASGAATGTWTAGTNTFTAATTTLTLGSTSGSGTVHVRRTPSDSTYMETAGSARYALPLQFDSAGDPLGLLMEPQRTNLVTNTSSASTWWAFGVGTSESANAATAITGLTEADAVLEDTSTGVHQIYRSFDSSAGTHAISMFVEPAGRTHCSLALATGKWSSFSLSGSGSVVKNSTGATGAIEKMSDTIYRISVVAAGLNDLIVFSTSNSEYSGTDDYGRASYTGDGTSGVNIYGTQIELGSSATSLIQTFGSTVTRAADNLSLATSAFPYSNTTGTLYVYASERVFESGRNNTLAELAADASNRTLAYRSASTTFTAASVGGTTMSVGLTTAAAPIGDTRLALAYAANDCAAVVDGGTVGTDNTFAAHTAATTLHIGDWSGGTAPWNGHIKALLFLPRRVSDADMQTLTSTGALP